MENEELLSKIRELEYKLYDLQSNVYSQASTIDNLQNFNLYGYSSDLESLRSCINSKADLMCASELETKINEAQRQNSLNFYYLDHKETYKNHYVELGDLVDDINNNTGWSYRIKYIEERSDNYTFHIDNIKGSYNFSNFEVRDLLIRTSIEISSIQCKEYHVNTNELCHFLRKIIFNEELKI